MKTTCSKCGKPRDMLGQNYCRSCHAAYMREWRKAHLLNTPARRKMVCRSYAKVYLKRGFIERFPCEICDEGESEMHHADYSKPLGVTWLCRKHHLLLHAGERRMSQISDLELS